MNKREPISKKLRFEIFKRDSFTCAYCGNKPPLVVLEIDHIVPVSKNGLSDLDNLITSCFDCNRGKSNIELSNIPASILDKHEIAKEKEEQYLAYKKQLLKIEKRIKKEIEEVANTYTEYFPDWEMTDKFKISVRTFVLKLGVSEVLDAIRKASNRRLNATATLSYFCGICWNKIRGNG